MCARCHFVGWWWDDGNHLPRVNTFEPSQQLYVYRWGNNPRRAELKGRLCRLLASGALGTVLVEMVDTGERVTTSHRALAPVSSSAPPPVVETQRKRARPAPGNTRRKRDEPLAGQTTLV